MPLGPSSLNSDGMTDDKVEMTTQVADKTSGCDLGGPISSIEKQVRTRRLFTRAQLFSFSFMYFVTWSGLGT